jgi:uncharacterized protein with HEPN domain
MTAAELASRLEDILEAIAVIGGYTAGKTFETMRPSECSEMQ